MHRFDAGSECSSHRAGAHRLLRAFAAARVETAFAWGGAGMVGAATAATNPWFAIPAVVTGGVLGGIAGEGAKDALFQHPIPGTHVYPFQEPAGPVDVPVSVGMA
jgi:hypothetical protein